MRKLNLTPAHIARIHRAVEDSGVVMPGFEMQTDADYEDWVHRIIQSHPDPSSPTQLFAYGSLIWRPEIEHTAEQFGVARGWHRAFCFNVPLYRGTPERPGLMMALDRGGQCHGVVYTLPKENLEGQLRRLFRREFTFKPITNTPRWITVQTASARIPALHSW